MYRKYKYSIYLICIILILFFVFKENERILANNYDIPVINVLNISTSTSHILTPNIITFSASETNQTVYIYGTFSDNDGCTEINDSTGAGNIISKLYRTGVTETAQENVLNMYKSDNDGTYPYSCNIGVGLGTVLIEDPCVDASDTTASFVCSVELRYFADATDESGATAHQYSSDTWTVSTTVNDSLHSSITSNIVTELESMISFKIGGTPSINYGVLEIGEISNDTTITIVNTGNLEIDISIHEQSPLLCNTSQILPENQRYTFSPINTINHSAKVDLTDYNVVSTTFNLGKRVDDVTNSSKDVSFSLELPNTLVAIGNCSGINLITITSSTTE